MKKRAQFYIIAAVILIAVTITAFSVTNYIRVKKSEANIYDLGKELNIETGRVLDYGMINPGDITNLTQTWSEKYYEYASQKNINTTYIFVYGTSTGEIKAIRYGTEDIGQVSIGGTILDITGTTVVMKTIPIASSQDKINITFSGYSYEFPIREGQNFYFVITTGNETITT